MPATSVIEAELVEASGFEATKNYERQDYLAAVARSINEVDDDVFDALSTEAQDWFNSAVKALNKKQDLPEFPDLEETDEDEEATDDAEGDEADEKALADEITDDEGDEESPPPKAKATAKKAAKTVKVKAEPEEEAEDIEEAASKHKPLPRPIRAPKKQPNPPAGNRDRYGVNENSKAHKAIQLLEDGCRMSDITEQVGGTYYNLLQKLVKDGHKLEKASNGFMKLTHKDGKKQKVKK